MSNFPVYIKFGNFVALDSSAVVLIRMQNCKFTSLRLRCIFGGSCKNRCQLQQLVDKVCSTNYPRCVQRRERTSSYKASRRVVSSIESRLGCHLIIEVLLKYLENNAHVNMI